MDNKLFKISYSINDSGTISKLSDQVLMEEVNLLPNIEEGNVDFHTMYVFDLGEKIEAKILIRNANKNSVNFQFVEFGLANESGKVITSQKVDLSKSSSLPPFSIRPLSIFFNKENIKQDVIINNDFKVLFLADNIETFKAKELQLVFADENLNVNEKAVVSSYSKDMSKISEDKIVFNICSKDINNKKKPFVIIIISNSYSKSLIIDGFNIIFRNYLGIPQAIKRVNFKIYLKDLSKSAYKFYIEAEDIINPEFDIRNCEITIEA